MSYQRISSLTTISGHGHAHWEYYFGAGDFVGPCFATAEIFNSYDDTNAQLVANNQGSITREGGQPNAFTNISYIYTVDIDNTDASPSQYFLQVGRFT
jgi:hypothetical protein